MSDEKQACVICGVKLTKPVMLGESAAKTWAKKSGYDGYQWREDRNRVMAILRDVKAELLEPYDHGFGADSVTFFTCMKHTGKEFTMGEEPESNQDEEGGQ